jgi:hypothetical protein
MLIFRDQRGSAAPLLIIVLLLVFSAIPLALHFTQKRHNHLPLDVRAAFPSGEQIVPGRVYATTLIAIMRRELEGGTGWRPNDFFLWGPKVMADNNANRQLGIIQAVRESMRIFKNHLTKVSASEYDPNLVTADTLFRNDSQKFWFPSAESRFQEGVQALEKYVAGLTTSPPQSRPINRRNVELIRLFQEWTDILGGAHASLFKDKGPEEDSVGWLQIDDSFYQAQGAAHVMYHLTLAVEREFEVDFAGRPTVIELLHEVESALGQAALIKPLVILDGSPNGLFANHRRNLDVYIVEARQKMYSIREELEK